MSLNMSQNADRALLFLYVLENGLPEPNAGEDRITVQLRVFQAISGLSEFEVLAAFAELQDAEMVG